MESDLHTPSFDELRERDAREIAYPKSWRRPLKGLDAILRAFSPSERLVLYVLSIMLGVSAFILLANVNTEVTSEVPTQGGSLVEGAVGTPRFINPLLAISQPDQDLTTLVYSGLLRADPSGNYIPDLAESFDISEDGTVYTFRLRENLTFHDGTPLTSDDVAFTVALAQNTEIKSVRRADWDGVTVATPDARTIVFTLPHAYAPFRENATLGILPKRLWESVPLEEFPFSSINTHPVGSGPYRLDDVILDTTGAPMEYTLRAFKNFALGAPNLTTIVYKLFANEEELLAAYDAGEIDSFVASSPKNLARGLQESEDLKKLGLARVFGIFLNQNHAPTLANESVRRALDVAIDKQKIVNEVLGGFGEVSDGPVPPGLLSTTMSPAATTTVEAAVDRIEEARAILQKGGWKYDAEKGTWTKDKAMLSFTISTADVEELAATAKVVADAWQAVGIPTSVQVYPLQEFNQNILRPRSYDAILFGEVVGRSLDLFAFWHSSQRNDPGLNLALYTSAAADRQLAAARAETDSEKRDSDLREFLETIDTDTPAVFIYSPELAYIVPARIKGVLAGTLSSPSDRFLSVHDWYRDTERIWNIFTQ